MTARTSPRRVTHRAVPPAAFRSEAKERQAVGSTFDPNNFWPKVDQRGADDCWEWQGTRSRKGYGRFWHERREYKAHRIALELVGRPVPSGKVACHSCDNPPCCNPAHLWAGTNRENMQDASRKGRLPKQALTHCKRGHPFSPENTYIRPGATTRHCRICSTELSRSYRANARRRAA